MAVSPVGKLFVAYRFSTPFHIFEMECPQLASFALTLRSLHCYVDLYAANSVGRQQFAYSTPITSLHCRDGFSMKKPFLLSARGASFYTKHASNVNVVRVVLLDANWYLAYWESCLRAFLVSRGFAHARGIGPHA
jgi:hypothetical protein